MIILGGIRWGILGGNNRFLHDSLEKIHDKTIKWQSCRPFKNTFKVISVDMVINMYPTFHEADISKFTAAMNECMTKFDIKIVLAR